MDKDNGKSWVDRHLWQIHPIKDLMWVGFFVLLILGLFWLRDIFIPVLIAFVLAYLFSPLIELMVRKWSVPRFLSVSVVLIFLGVALFGLTLWLGPLIVNQATTLTKSLQEYGQAFVNRYGEKVGVQNEVFEKIGDQMGADPISVLKPLYSSTIWTFGFMGKLIDAGTYAVMVVVVIPIYFFFFALRFHKFADFWEAFIPVGQRNRVRKIAGELDRVASSYFRGRLLIAIIMGGAFAIGWGPWLTDVPYWLLLGVVTGLLSLIPYAAGIGWLLAVFLSGIDLLTGPQISPWGWFVSLGGPTLVYIIVQFLESWFLTPWLQGKSLDLNPVTILVAVLIGGAVAGLLGVIFAIPVTAFLKLVLRKVVLVRLPQWEG